MEHQDELLDSTDERIQLEAAKAILDRHLGRPARSSARIKMPDVYPTNICFARADIMTVYLTLSDKGQLGVIQWPEPGLKAELQLSAA